jgi:exopolyphosphatase/guanosine-5'-triphosphate,3'-diphosphate pyrophosphatase
VKVAVIDLGTNSARLLLADVADGRVHDVVRETTVTRLGAGVDRRRRLDAAAVERTRACLAGYAAQVAGFAPAASLLVATSVLRDAADGPAFLERLRFELGLPWTILTGEEEATLSFSGAASGLSDEPGGVGVSDAAAATRRPATVVIDIGGGSMELAVGRRWVSQGRAAPSFVCSLDLGVVRLTERFLTTDPPDDAQWRAAQTFVSSTLARAVPAAVRVTVGEGIGLAGTFTTLVAHKLALRTYDRALVHRHVLTLTDLDGALATFRQMTSAARGRLAGIQPGREDVILAGVLLAREVCRLFGLAGVQVSEADLLDGVALSLARD